MEKKLFLTSSGLTPEIIPTFLSLLDDDPPNLRVGYIANAADKDWGRFFPDRTVNHLVSLGFNVEKIDLRKKKSDEIYPLLEAKDVIYVGGGNTYYLLDLLRKRKLDAVLSDLLDQGKVYLGVSAGSIVAGPDISLAGWKPLGDKNKVKLTETTGLNLINFSVLPHYLPELEPVVKVQKEGYFPKVWCLGNKQALSIVGDHQQLVGEGNSLELV